MDEFLDMTMDEDKENQTPKGLQWERDLDLVPQCNRNQEREEQELQQALTQSLMECVRKTTTCFSFFKWCCREFLLIFCELPNVGKS